MSGFNDLNHVKNLPDYYSKSENSNNFKILSIEKYAVDDLQTDITDVWNSLDINNATGATLELYGEMLNQPRGVATDAQYLYMIKSKIMRNLSGGDYLSVIKSICMTFDCAPSEVLILEKEEPCVVELVVLPLNVINRAGLTTRQTVAMIKELLPVGITLESFLFEGTFTFSLSESEYDEDAGFAPSEDDQTIGGYLGILYGEDDEPELPIGTALSYQTYTRRR